MNREEKSQVIDDVRATLERSKVAVVAHYRGMTVGEMTELRKKFRESGSEFRVVKNTLAKRAAEGTPFAGLASLLTGPTGLATSMDPVAPARVLDGFASGHPNLQIVGGVLDGKLVDAQGITALARLPSREVLLARMLGSMNAPIQGFVGVLAAVPGSFVRVLAQIQKQKEEQQAA
ncbi:MAG: 50S ribosomal protein L10 [Magnetococcales bacterium]|nr:50S ribosomal protein L10 [Magnetococcales bacterium]MBF0322468.1 50S ribosomal protein L10 [Magnetococcales bacterium]